MIGDWVFYEGSHRKIVLLDDAGFALLRPGENAEIIVEHDLDPIPITPEILEKNGFEKKLPIGNAPFYTFSDDDEYYALAIDEYTDSLWRIEYTNCEINFPIVRIMVCFVHELQHALRLCGIEKEIVI